MGAWIYIRGRVYRSHGPLHPFIYPHTYRTFKGMVTYRKLNYIELDTVYEYCMRTKTDWTISFPLAGEPRYLILEPLDGG